MKSIEKVGLGTNLDKPGQEPKEDEAPQKSFDEVLEAEMKKRGKSSTNTPTFPKASEQMKEAKMSMQEMLALREKAQKILEQVKNS